MRQMLIVGIDPGTTVGYAAIDAAGAFVAGRAAKEFSLDSLVAELSSLGAILIIATDKAKIPSFVSSVATKLGARVFAPEEDMRITEKRELTSMRRTVTDHERDALAAAIAAFKRHERLFSRIDRFLEERKQLQLSAALKELVVKQGIGIIAGFDFLTMAEKPETRILRRVHAERQLRPADYWKLYDTLVTAQREKGLLQRQNKKLLHLAKRLKKKNAELRTAVKPEIRILRPTAELEQAKQVIKDLQYRFEHTLSRQQRLQHVLLHQDNYVIAKKMRNLGFDEYKRVSRVLGFKEGDILFIEDINSFSERTLNELAPYVTLAISMKEVKPKVAERLPFVTLDAAVIPHTQDDYFAFLDKRALEKARGDKEVLRKLIKDYQQSRKSLG